MTHQLTLDEAAGAIGGLRHIISKGRPMWVGPCPLCKEGNDRFFMNENQDGKVMWSCRKVQHIKTRPDFFFADALLDMLGIRPLEPGSVAHYTATTRPEVQPPSFDELLNEPVQLTLADAIRFNKDSSPATKYFGQFGINQNTIDKFKLGYAVHPPYCSLPAGFTIPNISLGPNGLQSLRAMQIRRDEEACRQEWIKHGEQWIADRRFELLEKWTAEIGEGKRNDNFLRTPTDEELMEALGYPKYTSIKGSHSGIWGDDIVSLPDGSRDGKWLQYCFLVEDAKSALVLRQDGYPAVAYRRRNDWNAYLHRVFERVGSVYIIYDNDGGVGLGYAKEFEGFISKGGKSMVRLFTTPTGIKQVSDLTRKDGFEAMRGWLDSKFGGLRPILPAYQ